MDGRPGLQVHLPVQAGHPPVVLVLQVAVGRPAHDHAGEDVLARLQVGGDVELAGQPGVGARAGEAAVDVDEEHALRAADVEHDLAPPPRPRHPEPGPVHPGRVVVRDGRRGTGEGHLDVRVDRRVARALQRPARRDVDPPPGPVVSARPPTCSAATASGRSSEHGSAHRPSSERYHGESGGRPERADAASGNATSGLRIGSRFRPVCSGRRQGADGPSPRRGLRNDARRRTSARHGQRPVALSCAPRRPCRSASGSGPR